MNRHTKKNTNFAESFKCALAGICACIRGERNLRFHLAVGALICVFAYAYGLERTQWAVLALAIAAVIAAELFNSAIEAAVDTATEDWRASAKLAKDAAAGAALVTAACAVAVGIALFGDIARIWAALVRIFTTPYIFIIAAVIFIASVLFVIFGGDRRDNG